MFSGGAIERMSILALGIMPYISASIISNLIVATTPSLQQLRKEGEAGRRKIAQYTRYGTLLLATVQGFAMSNGLAVTRVGLRAWLCIPLCGHNHVSNWCHVHDVAWRTGNRTGIGNGSPYSSSQVSCQVSQAR